MPKSIKKSLIWLKAVLLLRMKINKPLIIAILIPVAVGIVSGFATRANIPTWYATLNKPWFNPPNWIFAPVWTILYICMGVASYLVYKSAHPQRKTALILYAIQLLLNSAWSFLFFYFKLLTAAFYEIIVLWVFINLTIVAFARINKTAMYLLLPYIAWVSFASLLTYSIMVLNP